MVGSFAMFLYSCTAMSATDCASADWRTIGERDGRKGLPLTTIAKYNEDCGKHGISADEYDYEDGHADGVEFYCTPSSGYTVGRNNRKYHGVCQGASYSDFMSGFSAGQKVYHAASDVAQIETKIHDAEMNIDRSHEKLDEHEEVMDSDESTQDDREASSKRIKELRRKIRRLEREVDVLRASRILAIAEYREAVREVRTLGFTEDFRY